MIKDIVNGFRLVLSSPWRVLAILSFSALTYFLIVFIHNYSFIKAIVFFNDIDLTSKFKIFFITFISAGGNLAPDALTLSVLVSVLFGLNLVFIFYFFKVRREALRSASTGGVVGLLLGAIGAGCLACGSLILSFIASIFGGAAFVASLPLAGLEFSVAAAAVLFVSTAMAAREAGRPLIC